MEPEFVVHEKLEVVLSRLEGVRRQSDGSFRSRCPVHGGKTTDDMKLTAGDKWINIHCFAGCDYDEIRRKLDLEWVDLVLDDSPAAARKSKRRDWRAIELESYACAARLQHEPKVLEKLRFGRGWAAKALELLGVGWDGSRLTLPVRSADLKLHDVLRYDPFTQARKILAGKGKSRLPWPSPEFVAETKVLFLVEGEGTAISMASVGFKAVALPGSVSRPTTSIQHPGRWQGAGWHPRWADRFRRFARLILLPDCDEQGRSLMRAASYDLTKAGVENHVIDIGPRSTDGRDIADHLLSKAYDGPSRKIARDVIRLMVAEKAEVLVA
jgi:hypothetical protein